jgi:molybdate transport system regulatory protein
MGKVDIEIYLSGCIGKGRIKLLQLIDKYGSISKAAKELGMSYKTAWDSIDTINNISPEPVVVSKSGGKGGGKTQLTEYGKKLLEQYKILEKLMEKVSYELSSNLGNVENILNIYRRLNMKVSARNQILAKISNIKKGAVNSEIEVEINGVKLISVITNEAVEELDLKIGDEIYLIAKASNVIISLPENLKISARNQLKGKIKNIIKGSVNSEIKISVGNITITAVITNEAVKDLDLNEGKEVLAVIKASDFIVGKI